MKLLLCLLLLLFTSALETGSGFSRQVLAAGPTTVSSCDEAHLLAALNTGGLLTFRVAG